MCEGHLANTMYTGMVEMWVWGHLPWTYAASKGLWDTNVNPSALQLWEHFQEPNHKANSTLLFAVYGYAGGSKSCTHSSHLPMLVRNLSIGAEENRSEISMWWQTTVADFTQQLGLQLSAWIPTFLNILKTNKRCFLTLKWRYTSDMSYEGNALIKTHHYVCSLWNTLNC